MITRERLEELIKQGALIYLVSSIDNEVYSMQLNSYFTINSRCLVDEGGYWYKLDELFETKDRAEWALKTTTERTERFEPPMWEDIENYYRFVFVNYENGYLEEYSFELLKEQDDKAKDGGYISIWTVDNDIYYRNTATKENYIKACEIVRDLFNKGGV